LDGTLVRAGEVLAGKVNRLRDKGDSMLEWYYAKDDRQLGPVTMVSLRQLIASGSLRPTDLVWRDGMANWAQVRTIGELFSAASAMTPRTPGNEPVLDAVLVDDDFVASQPAAQGSSARVDYFSAASVLSGRAHETLAGFPTPTGPQEEWPLSTRQLAQLAETEKHRKAIRTCSTFFNTLCVLYILVVALVGAATLISRPRGGTFSGEGAIYGLCGVLIALAVLAFIAKGAVLRCRIWAPITFLVIFGLSLIMDVVAVAMNDFNSGSFNSRNGGIEPMVGIITSGIIMALFAWPCIRALTAIPKFRAAPVWAQEALVNAKL
jgi:hypothetical protein